MQTDTATAAALVPPDLSAIPADAIICPHGRKYYRGKTGQELRSASCWDCFLGAMIRGLTPGEWGMLHAEAAIGQPRSPTTPRLPGLTVPRVKTETAQTWAARLTAEIGKRTIDQARAVIGRDIGDGYVCLATDGVVLIAKRGQGEGRTYARIAPTAKTLHTNYVALPFDPAIWIPGIRQLLALGVHPGAGRGSTRPCTITVTRDRVTASRSVIDGTSGTADLTTDAPIWPADLEDPIRVSVQVDLHLLLLFDGVRDARLFIPCSNTSVILIQAEDASGAYLAALMPLRV